ncbi:MAG: hypothetical protein ACNA7U_07375, partial [Candidatus Izemoplasmataceae bacterium]
MKKLFLFVLGFTLFFSLSLFNETTVEASWADVSVTLTSYFEDDDNILHTPAVRAYGSTFAFDSNIDSNPNYRFAFWIWNGVVRADLPVDHEFIIRSTTDLEAVFAPVALDGPQPVVAAFVDTNGVLIDLQYVLSGSVADDPTLEVGYEAPTKPKYLQSEVSPWGQSLEAITEDTVYVVNYEIAPTAQFDLVVNNGTGGGIDIAYNTIVTVTADAPGVGEYFAGWQVNNVLVSYDEEYSFSLLGDKTITALYSETEVTKEPLISLSPDLELTTAKKSFLAQFSLPAGYTLIEYGMIRSNEPSSLTFASADNVFIGTVYTSETKEFLMAFTAEFGSIAAYLTYKDNLDVIHTVYSNQIDYYEFHETFDNASLTASYLSGSFVGNDGITWTYSGSRNEGDYPIDGSGIMLHQASYSYLEAKIPNGISGLYFEYRKAFTRADERQLEIIITETSSGVIHTLTGEPFGAFSGADETIFVFSNNDLEIEGEFTLRIKNVGSTSTNRQTVIDNIKWSNYGEPSGYYPVFDGVSPTATITEGESYNPKLGVTASDVEDGDLTDDITFTVKDSLDNTVTTTDFSELETGDYLITLSVEDSDGNVTTATVSLTILDSEAPTTESLTITLSSLGTSSGSYANNTPTYFAVGGYNFVANTWIPSSGDIQGQADNFNLYNLDSFGEIVSIVVTLRTASAHTLYSGSTSNPTTNSITPTINGAEYTYDFSSSGYQYFKIQNNATVIYI